MILRDALRNIFCLPLTFVFPKNGRGLASPRSTSQAAMSVQLPPAGSQPSAGISIRTTTTKLQLYRMYPILITTTFLLLVSTVTSYPLRESPSLTEPMSVADGYIHYSVGNETYLKDLSRQAFQMLNSGIEPQILLHPNKALPADKPKKKHRKPGRRKPPLDGRTHALLSLNDPNGLKKEQHCEGEKFKQRVKSPGCLTKVIVNRFCHGTCSSYFIPRLNAKKLKAVFKSCAACAPKDYDTVDVTLDCPGQNPPQVIKTIIKIKRCECMNVDISSQLRL